MTRSTKVILILLAITVALVAAFILVFPIIIRHNTEKRIHNDWARLEEICKNKSWSDLDEHGWGLLVRFKDGDYIALRYDDCPEVGTLSQYDCYALGISGKGKKFFSEYRFDGYEGLCGRLTHSDYLDLADFLRQTADCNWVDAGTEPLQQAK